MNLLERTGVEDISDIIFNLPEKEVKEKFTVKDLHEADWCLRKIRTANKKREEIEELARLEIDRINAWKEKELHQLDEGKAFFEGLLVEYLISRRKVDPKFKISTPYGKVSTRKQPSKWEYDEETILQYLKQSGNNQFIRIKEEVDKENLKKSVEVVNGRAVTENGEIIEGIIIREQVEKIEIKVVE
ncbi:MAG: host-nuclease inhibitor Gam family protein [Bacillota bacterium]